MAAFSSPEVEALLAAVDPPETPYKSRYAAVKVLKELRGVDADDAVRCAAIDCRLAQIHLDTEEPHEAEKRLAACLSALEPTAWGSAGARPVASDGDASDASDEEIGADRSARDVVVSFSPPPLAELPPANARATLMDAYNSSGLLWCNRGQTGRVRAMHEISLALPSRPTSPNCFPACERCGFGV